MNYDTSIGPDKGHTSVYPDGPDSGAALYGEADDEEILRSRRKWIIAGAILLIAVLAVVAALLMRDGEPAAASSTEASQAPAVTVLVPGRTTVANTITATGTLAARRPIPVGSVGEGGEVSRVLVDAGDWVKQGQVLATIDRSVQSRQVQGQAAQVEVARADARLAESNLERALKLVDRGFISTADVDRLTATRDAAVARVRVADAQLGELRARNERLNIVAPAGGLVLMRQVEPGQVVSGGSGSLFTIAQGGEMELQAMVSESDLAQLSVGVNVEVIPVGSGKTFTGQIWQISPTIEEDTRQGIAHVALPYDVALRPGGFASARITAGAVAAPVLPESAILSDEESSFVFIVDKNNRVRRRAVRLGLVSPEGISIVEGLSGTEKIVLRAGGFLNDGDLINPRPATQAAVPAGGSN